jgi:hypothetical protein
MRSGGMNLARRFNAGIGFIAISARSDGCIRGLSNLGHATGAISQLFPALKGRVKFIWPLRVEDT